MWNHFSANANRLALYPVAPWALWVLQGIASIPILYFILFVINNITPLHLPGIDNSGFGWTAVFVALFMAQFLWFVVSIIQKLSIGFHWDLKQRVLTIQMPKHKNKNGTWGSDYEKVPRSIPFDAMDTLVLRRFPFTKQKQGYLLELHWTHEGNSVFFPLTAFRDVEKARKISRALQSTLTIAMSEVSSETYNFKDYKKSFLEQFGEVP